MITKPSKLITTAQIVLNSVVKTCLHNDEEKQITFCACDKNCDGLIDSLSHIVLQSLTEVSATNIHSGTASYMSWEADNQYWQHRMLPNISRYLGIGTELALAAVKNQVSKTTWYGGYAFPVSDMRWISRQYYNDLLKFAGLPVNQNEMENRFITNPNYLEAKKESNNYMIVEDEAYNMFEVLRNFSTRAKTQSFVNIISSDYLLKDYMAYNDKIFRSDSKAIPYFVADYARTNRNVILRLVLMMSCGYISEERIINEFSMIGIKPDNICQKLWHELYKCYASAEDIKALDKDYDTAVEQTKKEVISIGKQSFDIGTVLSKQRFNISRGKLETVYYIKDKKFIELCTRELGSAQYIAEDEKNDEFYLGEELRGHIFQKYLPGQFFTFDGKYYEVISITGANNLLVRRAADHIDGRPSYRQIRHYGVYHILPSEKMGESKVISGIRITKCFADITVDTPAYFRMRKYSDFVTARKVEINNIPQRVYNNKIILKIEFPQSEQFTYDVRYTITTLLNEVFRTLFADNQAYIVALTKKQLVQSLLDDEMCTQDNAPQADESAGVAPEAAFEPEAIDTVATEDARSFETHQAPAAADEAQAISDGIDNEAAAQQINETSENIDETAATEEADEAEEPAENEDYPLTYSLETDDEDENSIYIVEDSQLDLGLLIAVERNLKRIFEIVTDYLDWNALAIEESLHPPVEPQPPQPFTLPVEDAQTGAAQKGKKRGVFGRIKDKIKSLFKRKKKKGKDPVADAPQPAQEQPTDTAQPPQTNAPTPEQTPAATSEGETANTSRAYTALFSIATTSGLENEEKTQDEAVISPAQTEAEPVDSEAEPVESEAEPVESEAEPVESDAEPVDSEAEPVESEAEPVESETEPVESEAAPVESEAEPVESEAEPVESEAEPVESETPIDISGENEVVVEHVFNTFKRKPYHENYFLLFGHHVLPKNIVPQQTHDFLATFDFDQNALKESRESKDIAELIASGYNPMAKGKRFCDFCGCELFGTEFEVLSDGRERCMQCSKTAIKTGDDFVKIFTKVKKNVEAFYGININVPVSVKMVNSKKLHKRLGEAFIPTSGFDARVLGVAIKDKNGYSLYVENGSPRMQSMLTMAHELTHIWQYVNWNDKDIIKKYGSAMRLEVYEGMAKWVEIQYAYLINEPEIAKREEILTAMRQDEYGRGFLKYLERYPFSKGSIITKETPFMDKKNPL